MGARHGAMRHWLDRGDSIDSWAMGLIDGVRDTGWTGAMRLRGNGIDLWARVMGVRDWIGEMGLICGDTPWGYDAGGMWAMGLSYGGVPWGCATGSG